MLTTNFTWYKGYGIEYGFWTVQFCGDDLVFDEYPYYIQT